jgi:hypothetical protein
MLACDSPNACRRACKSATCPGLGAVVVVVMTPSIKQSAGPRYPPKMRRKSLIDDHAGRSRGDPKRNGLALRWSLGVTYKVLMVQGNTSVAGERLRELHARLFSVTWPGLRNLRDGWITKAFRPLTHADLNPSGIPDRDELQAGRVTMIDPPSGHLPATMQLGILLGWKWPDGWNPTHEPNGTLERVAGSLADGFRAVGYWSMRDPPEGRHAAKTWDKRRTRQAKAVRELEGRISAEGVSIEWSTEPNTEPCFRSTADDGPAVTVA